MSDVVGKDYAMSETPDRARLRELAAAATPGPWRAGCPTPCNVVDSRAYEVADTSYIVEDGDPAEQGPKNAAYIEALSPDVVLVLLDELERVERERDTYKTLSKVGVWHNDCRLNRHQAARELEKSQAVIDKVADAISVSNRRLEQAEAENAALRERLAKLEQP